MNPASSEQARKKPNTFRRRLACPECGFIYRNEGALSENTVTKPRIVCGMSDPVPVGIKCPRCSDYTLWAQWWLAQYEKWGWKSEPSDVED